MKRTGARGAGEFQEITWDEAIAELVAQLDALAAAGDQKSLACLTRPRRSRRARARRRVPRAFRRAAADRVRDLRRGRAAPRQRDQLRPRAAADDRPRAIAICPVVRRRFPRHVELAGGAERGLRPDAAGPSGQPGVRGKFVQVESRMSQTGANADEWVPVKPGHRRRARARPGARDPRATSCGRPMAAAARGRRSTAGRAVSPTTRRRRSNEITGVPATRVERLARELAELQPAVAVIGGAPLAHTNGLFHALAVNALNGLLGTVGQPGGIFFTPGVQRPPSRRSQLRRPSSAARCAQLWPHPSAKVLLVDGANPVFGSPKALKVREALEKVPFIVSFGSFIDDTSSLADLILPDHSFLESWVDVTPESGSIEAVTTVAGPAMKPLYQTRATRGRVDRGRGEAEAAGGAAVEDRGRSREFEAGRRGRREPTRSRAASPQCRECRSPPFTARAYERAALRRRRGAVPVSFPAVSVAAIRRRIGGAPAVAAGNARSADIGDVEQLGGNQPADGGADAHRAGRSRRGPLAAGRRACAGDDLSGHWRPMSSRCRSARATRPLPATRAGAASNPIAILAPVTEAETGALAWAATRVSITRAGDPDGTLIMFAGAMREHPHEHETR